MIKREAGDLSVKLPGEQEREGGGGRGAGRKERNGSEL